MGLRRFSAQPTRDPRLSPIIVASSPDRSASAPELAAARSRRTDVRYDLALPSPSFSQPSGCGLSPDHALAQIEHLDADHAPLAVEIEHDPRRHLLRLDGFDAFRAEPDKQTSRRP